MNLPYPHNVNMGKPRKDKKKSPHYLSAWREFRHMTQEQLAEKVGTTKSSISMIETGDRGLSDKWARRLAAALHTKPGMLLDIHPEDLPSDILEIWADVPESDRAQARQILETFRKRTGTNG